MAYPEFELIPDLTESEFAIDPTQLTLEVTFGCTCYIS